MIIFILFLIVLLFITLINNIESETKIGLLTICLLIFYFLKDLCDEPVSFFIYILCAVVATLIFVGIEDEREKKAKEKSKRDSRIQYAKSKQRYYSVNKDDKEGEEKNRQIQENADLSLEFLKRVDNFTGTIQRIKWNKDFANNMETVNGLSLVGDKDDQYDFIFNTDVACCYRMMYDNLSPYNSKSGIALAYIMAKVWRHSIDLEDPKVGLFNYQSYSKDIAEQIFEDKSGFWQSSAIFWEVNYILKRINEHFSNYPDHEEPLLIAAELLQPLDTNLQQQYVDTIVDILQTMNVVNPAQSENLQKVNEFLQQYSPVAKVDDFSLGATESKQHKSSNKNTVGKISSNLQNTLQSLDDLIGLENVKQQVHSLIKFIQVQQQREKHNLKTTPISYHCVFSGSPGTGKTTVARILAQIYKDLGILKKGHLIETDRAGLVGEYVGQTAVKTNKVINSAVGGVLFIDEAYSLYSESSEDYGREAIATLLKRMEDERDNLVVVMAGYTEEMKQFIDLNPGLRSRFNRYIDFTDYSPSELFQIFKRYTEKGDFKLTSEAENAFRSLFINAYTNRDRTFGNARFVRNIFEKTIERQSLRVADISEPSVEQLTTITEDDVPMER